MTPPREATGLSVSADDEKAIAAKVEREQKAFEAARARDLKAIEAAKAKRQKTKGA